jgi:DNA-binding transcriptional regulator LsrR (DeoR family)
MRGRKSLAKTNPKLVKEIQWYYFNTSMSAYDIARRFGISQPTVLKYTNYKWNKN